MKDHRPQADTFKASILEESVHLCASPHPPAPQAEIDRPPVTGDTFKAFILKGYERSAPPMAATVDLHTDPFLSPSRTPAPPHPQPGQAESKVFACFYVRNREKYCRAIKKK